MDQKTSVDRQARVFHKRCQRIANRVGADLVGSDHKADTLTLTHYSNPTLRFTVPYAWACELNREYENMPRFCPCPDGCNGCEYKWCNYCEAWVPGEPCPEEEHDSLSCGPQFHHKIYEKVD